MTDAPTDAELALRKRTRVKAFIAGIAIVVLVLLLWFTPSESAAAKGYAITAGALVLVREICSAFARDGGLKLDKSTLEDTAAIASLFAVVFGVPALATSIF